MKYFLGFHKNEMVFVKNENNKFYYAQAYSDQSIKFEELPHKPKILLELDSLPTENKNYISSKADYHRKFKEFLLKNGYTDFKLITENPYSDNLLFTLITNVDDQELFDERDKLLKLTQHLKLKNDIDFNVHCLNYEIWNSRRY